MNSKKFQLTKFTLYYKFYDEIFIHKTQTISDDVPYEMFPF